MTGSAEPGGERGGGWGALLTSEFKGESVALWATSGRTKIEVAGELGIMPMMLRRWQRGLGVGEVKFAAQPSTSLMASPADHALRDCQAAARSTVREWSATSSKKAGGIFAEMPR